MSGKRDLELWILHYSLFFEFLLRLPQVRSALWCPWRWELSYIFWNWHLTVRDDQLVGQFHLVFEPGVRNQQVKVTSWLDGWISPQEDLPMVVDVFEDWCKSDTQEWHIFPCQTIPHDFHFLTFGVGDNLSSHVDLIRDVKDIKT